jgi:hypothetical protein
LACIARTAHSRRASHPASRPFADHRVSAASLRAGRVKSYDCQAEDIRQKCCFAQEFAFSQRFEILTQTPSFTLLLRIAPLCRLRLLAHTALKGCPPRGRRSLDAQYHKLTSRDELFTGSSRRSRSIAHGRLLEGLSRYWTRLHRMVQSQESRARYLARPAFAGCNDDALRRLGFSPTEIQTLRERVADELRSKARVITLERS